MWPNRIWRNKKKTWTKWLPWRYVVSRMARSHGFLDPIALLAKMHRFAQPSEVSEPIELLRAGVLFHARGLINSRAIQHNLDWVWPFWVERQFNPADDAFIPRAFSITHVNLSHRNWTAVGQPDCDWMPIVDPHGLVTPLFDGWSIDAWLLPAGGPPLFPSRAGMPRQGDSAHPQSHAHQQLRLEGNLCVATQIERGAQRLASEVEVQWEGDQPCCRITYTAAGIDDGWLAISLRPTNPEGISFIHHLEIAATKDHFLVDAEGSVQLDVPADRICVSNYRDGDVSRRLRDRPCEEWDDVPAAAARQETCEVGLITAAALRRITSAGEMVWTARVPLEPAVRSAPTTSARSFSHHPMRDQWSGAMEGLCRLQTPDPRWDFLFSAAVHNLVLHSPGEVYPGPYTYKRFWFRDAAFILNGLLAAGAIDRVERAITLFPKHQTAFGYFKSQEGEWDSNGEAIWIIDRFTQLSGRTVSPALIEAVAKGAHWIARKRSSDSLDAPHAGLLPAGFSAEHLGLNDYYYWDDFWSHAGLLSAQRLLAAAGRDSEAEQAAEEAQRLADAIDRSIAGTDPYRENFAIAASPYRRMDSGAVGSLVIGYPLQLCHREDPRLLATADYLYKNCLHQGGFFQDMIHSGVNAYLTLHLAQVFLRAGDPRWQPLVDRVAALASPTGQWPEAIHPRSGGGCMGDGQHIWAAAEWVLMMCHSFVREEQGRLILAAGIPGRWLEGGRSMSLGPTLTAYGPVTVQLIAEPEEVEVRVDGRWHREAPAMEVRLPGWAPQKVVPGAASVRLRRTAASSAVQESSR